MKVLLLAALAVGLGLVQASTQPRAPERLEIVLLVGQSNMAGRGAVDGESRVVDPEVWMLTKERAWAPATDPLHFDKPTMVGVGPGLAAGKALAAAWGKPVGLVPCAVGGSSIEEWGAKRKNYVEAIARAKAALEHGELRAILWHQGESNSSPEKVGKYPEQLTELIGRFKKDLDAPEVPVVVGEIGEWKGKGAEFNAMIRKYPTTHPGVGCVSVEGLKDRGDQLHFDTASARELGKRYAEKVLEMEKKASTTDEHR